jgi:hypothetical protein
MANAGSSITNPVWKTLWKLKVPGKVIISLWRALHGILPLKSILANRHIGTSGECPICHQGAEDILHLIFQCDTVRELWAKLGLENIISNAIVVARAGSTVLEHLLRMQDNSIPGFDLITLKETISVTALYLWWIRCRRTNNEDFLPLFKCNLSILASTTNAIKADKQVLLEIKKKMG